tara:strand:+ start:122 stop:391 length:270 start_codon:yes stop_codon:yes gene_type:complete
MSARAKKDISRELQVNARETFFCEVCGFPLKSREDFQTNAEYMCCHDCFLTFAQSDREGWKNGSRPEKKLIKNYINKKKKLFMKRRELQ